MFEVPIKFRFLEKLKLYQDFLSKNALTEKTKSYYWDYEKLILKWAYSKGHQHLGGPIDTGKLKHLFGVEVDVQEIDTNNKNEKKLIKRIKK